MKLGKKLPRILLEDPYKRAGSLIMGLLYPATGETMLVDQKMVFLPNASSSCLLSLIQLFEGMSEC